MINLIIDKAYTALYILTECLLLIYYSNSTMRYRKSRLISNSIIAAGYFLYFIICLLNYPTINLLGFVIFTFLVLYIGFDETAKSVLLRVILLTVFMMFSDLAASIISNVEISHEQRFYFFYKTGSQLLFTMISKMLYFAAIIILKRFSESRKYTYKTQEMLLLLLLPIFTCAYFALFNYIALNSELESGAILSFLILGFVLIVTNCVVYIVCDRAMDKNIQLQHLREAEQVIKNNQENYKILKANENNLRILKHDILKHMSTIREMVKGSENENVIKYTNELERTIRDAVSVTYTGNSAMDSILNIEGRIAGAYDIKYLVKPIIFSDIKISGVDITALLRNALDNAIEAQKNFERKCITTSITADEKYLKICIENFSEPIEIEYGRTTKGDKLSHGYGLKSIKTIAEKYNGEVATAFNSGIFTLKIKLENKFSTISQKV